MPGTCVLLAALLASAVSAAPETLVVANRPVAVFRASVIGNEPADRVRAAKRRIDALPASAFGDPITTQPVAIGGESGFAVLVGQRLTFFVTEGDRDPLGGDEPAEKVAAAAADRLAEALRAWRDQRSMTVVIRGLWQSGVATLVLILAIWTLVRLRRLVTRLLSRVASRGAIHVWRGRLDVAPAVSAAVRAVLFVLFWSTTAVLAEIWLTFVLGRFPLTAPWADILTSRFVAILSTLALGVLGAAPGVAAVVIILALARFVAQFAGGVFDRVERGTIAVPGLYPETIAATRRIATALIWLIALVAAYPYIPGAGSDAVRGLSLLVGVMVSLGSTGLVSQAMAGLAVIYSRALSPGDTVIVGDTEGVVTHVGLLSTKLVTLPGEEVTYPNSVVLGGAVRNFSRLSREHGPLVTTRVTIGYDAPWRQVHELLVGAARVTSGIRHQPAPFVLQRALSDFYVEYQLLAHLEGDPAERPRILSALHEKVQDAFNEAGVQIMSPHFMMQPREPVVARPERLTDQGPMSAGGSGA